MKIALIGANGQLGTYLSKNLEYNITKFTKENLNILKPIDKNVFEDYDVVINCAAFTDTKKAENDDLNYLVNYEAVKNIVKSLNGQLFVHISSAFVFKPKSLNHKNKELDFLEEEPLTSYGKAKWLADKFIYENLSNYLVIRPSWLISGNKSNFLSKLLSLNLPEYKIVTDDIGQITNGKMILDILNLAIQKKTRGFYNVGCSISLSRYDMFTKAIDMMGKKIKVEKTTTNEINFDISKIKYQIMDVTKYEKIFGPISSDDALKEWWKNEVD